MKKSKCLIISFILGLIYVIYSIVYWGGTASAAIDSSEMIGTGIATMLVLPHLVMTIIAVIFNGFGAFLNKRGFALTGGILYGVAMILFLPYFMFVIIQMILSFVGYCLMRNK